MSANALEIRGLKKDYPGFSLDIDELTLPRGCIMGLVGENGAGKSTAIKCMLDIAKPDGGAVSILGRPGPGAAREDVGVVLDEVGVPGLTAVQTGKVMARIFPNWDAAAYAACLRRLDVPEKKGFADLSRGMKMKLGIAVALSHHPKLLILDEATNGLDPVAREQVTDMLWEFTRNGENAVLLSSHIVSDLEKLCDYVAFLHRGRVLLREEKDALVSEYGLLRCPAARLEELEPAAVLTRRVTPYGAEAVVRRDGVPAGAVLESVGLEEIFVAMVKEDRT